jgi:phosphotransferase system  glucose/maltose/N-acetylglucosamine-specific IIC component
MIDWLDTHLVPEWRKAWKRWSVWLGALAGSGVTTMLAQPQVMFTVLNYLPADPTQRALAALGIGLAVWFAPTITVLLRQKNLEVKTDDAAE